jgi:hypothetical protein
VVEQHPLANPQAASSISFARIEDWRKFMVTLPVRTEGAGRVENSFIEIGENTDRTASDELIRATLFLRRLTPADRLNLGLRFFRTWQVEE